MIKTDCPNNNKMKLFVIWIIVLAAWLIMTITPSVFKKTGWLINDPYDRSTYFERGKWFTEGTLPLSEYPPVPTFLFGINHLTSMWVDADMQVGVYFIFFSLEMMLVLFLVFKVLLELLPPTLGNYAFLVLLPPTLYFTYNRFDILPACLCLFAFSAATKRQWVVASIILAIATFTKWYPILLFPGFFMYAKTLESKSQWKMIVAFSLTSCAILLLTYLYGGLETVLAPYQFHMARGMEYAALPVLLDNLIRSLLDAQISSRYFFLLFFIIQVSGPVLIFFIKLESPDKLIDYCIVAISLFVLFSRIWSPQWYLWLIPFLIVSVKNMKKASIVILYNLTAYLCFPVFFYYYGDSSYQLKISSLLTYAILFAIIFQSIRNLKPNMAWLKRG